MGKKHAPNSNRPSGHPATLRTLVLAAFVLLPAGVAGWGYHVMPARAAWARGWPETAIAPAQVEFTAMPAWLEEDFGRRVLADANLIHSGRLDLADPALVSKVARAFRHNAWVTKVTVTKAYQRLRIELQFRRPILFVPVRDGGGKGCYVDGAGVVVPAEQARVDALRQCFVVEGLEVDEAPVLGARLTDPRVGEAARLADALQPCRTALGIVVLRILAPHDADCRFELVTQGGSRIYWGTLDGAEAVDRDQKIRRLVDHATRYGSLDHPNGPYRFDVTTQVFVDPVAHGAPQRLPSLPSSATR